MKLIFASPTYGPIDPQALRYQRSAIMHSAKHGCEWLGDASPDRESFAAARNNVIHSIIHDDSYPSEARIVWVDSDVILPADAITRLAHSNHDFISGIYFQRNHPHWPLVASYNQEKNLFNWLVNWPKNSIFPADGCGFGIVLTSLNIFREMDAPWFEYKKFSEDFDFCIKAKDLGYQLYVDSGVLCGHLPDPKPVTLETFNNAHPELFGGKEDVKHETKGNDMSSGNEQEGQERQTTISSIAV